MAGDDDVGRHLESQERRNFLKVAGATGAAALGGCVTNRTSPDTSTSTNTDTPTETATATDNPDDQTETGTEEGTPENEETPEENNIGELLENNIETSNQLWNIMPQGSTENAGVKDVVTQRAVAEEAGFKHKFSHTDFFPYRDKVKDEDLLGFTSQRPNETTGMIGYKYSNDTDMEAISDSLSEETEGLEYRGHTLHKIREDFYWVVNAEDNATYRGVEDDVKLVVDMVEDGEPSMAEKVPWVGSETYKNNIILASTSGWKLRTSGREIEDIKGKIGGEVEDVMHTFTYDLEEEQAYDVLWTYDGETWQEDERRSVVLPVALPFVEAK